MIAAWPAGYGAYITISNREKMSFSTASTSLHATDISTK